MKGPSHAPKSSNKLIFVFKNKYIKRHTVMYESLKLFAEKFECGLYIFIYLRIIIYIIYSHRSNLLKSEN